MSEELLVHYCAPTLAGLKTGNLFTCPYDSKDQVTERVRALNRILVPKGLRVLPMGYARGRVLIYVYRPAGLTADLDREEVRSILTEAGYPCLSESYCVAELARRLEGTTEFPHEIGVFLSYPPEDVRGFMRHGGADCKCIGCWKVYGDAEQAKQTFRCYQRCTEHLCARFQGGADLAQLTVSAC